jgi:general secretion pathway protein F
MTAFHYIAFDQGGRKQAGVIEADNARQIRQILRDKALAPISVEAVRGHRKGAHQAFSKGAFFQRMNLRELAALTRQLATLIQAGLPVEQALAALARQGGKPRIASMLSAVRARVVEGYSFADSLAAFPGSFSELFIGSVHAGERTGHLGAVLEYLADYTEQMLQTSQKLLLALLYPAILMAVSLLIILFLMTSIMPDMVKLFTDTDHPLPALTRGLIAMSHFLHDYGWITLAVLIGLALYGRSLLKRPALRMKWEKRTLRLPVIGTLIQQHNTAQFATTLGMLRQSGVPLLQALEITAAMLKNLYVRATLEEVARKVSEGVSLSAALGRSTVFPPILVAMVDSGEASGHLDTMLMRAGAMQQRDLQNRVAVLLGIFEPMILLFMGGIVLMLVLAIILPILGLNQMVK